MKNVFISNRTVKLKVIFNSYLFLQYYYDVIFIPFQVFLVKKCRGTENLNKTFAMKVLKKVNISNI